MYFFSDNRILLKVFGGHKLLIMWDNNYLIIAQLHDN